ncbi:MAG TPA: hypothetical protein VF400_02040 [Anaeromyxobacteraceae bacterium]
MTKIAAKIVTSLAVLSLAAPAFAASAAPLHHRKVAQVEQKQDTQKTTVKKAAKKHKAHVQPAVAKDPAAAPAPAPAPAK